MPTEKVMCSCFCVFSCTNIHYYSPDNVYVVGGDSFLKPGISVKYILTSMIVLVVHIWFSNEPAFVHYYIPRRKSGIYWIQVRRAAAAAAVEISLWTR